MGTEPQLHFVAQQFLEHEFHRALQIADGDAFVHVKALDLLESGVVRGVRVVAAIDAAGHDDAHGRRLLFHHANLDGGSMRAQEQGVTPDLTRNRRTLPPLRSL